MGDRFHVAEDLREYPLRLAILPVGVRNALLRGGCETLGDLHDLPVTDVKALRGVGTAAIREIRECLQRMQDAPPLVEESARQPPPDWTREFKVADIPVPLGVQQMLTEAGIATLFDLWQATGRDYGQIEGVGKRKMAELERLTSLLIDVGPSLLEEVSQDGQRVPSAPAQVTAAVAKANSYAEEVHGLVTDLSGRDGEFFLRRICFRGGPQPTLEELGFEHGLTRERVRQIVRAREKLLSNSGLRMPIASHLVSLTDQNDGIMSTACFMEAAGREGTEAGRSELQALPYLAELGLVPNIVFLDRYETWLSQDGIQRWQQSGVLEAAIKRVRKEARRLFRKMSCAPSSTLPDETLLDPQQVRAIVRKKRGKIEVLADHIIPVPIRESRLTRQARKMLVVAPRLILPEMERGLRRDSRMPKPPPTIVLERIFRQHPDFVVNNDVVSLFAKPDRSEVLSDSEQVFVELLEDEGGAMEYWEIMDAVVTAGFSQPMVSVLLRRPFVRRPEIGIYALRGVDVSRELIARKRQVRLDARSENKVSAGWVDPLTYEVTYKLSRINLDGVLAIPPSFDVAVEEWTGLLPDGSKVSLKLRNRFLWSLSDWFEREQVEVNDYVIATFFPGDRTVELDYIPGQESANE